MLVAAIFGEKRRSFEMGLDTTHDAFHGAYSAFDRWRGEILKAAGGRGGYGRCRKEPAQEGDREGWWYYGPGYSGETHPGLHILLCHSDCDGEISPEDCAKVADDLEALLPALEESLLTAGDWESGHIVRYGGFMTVTKRFISGCLAAAKAGEALEFK